MINCTPWSPGPDDPDLTKMPEMTPVGCGWPYPEPPAVPKYSGGKGSTSVDDKALKIFAANVAALIKPVEDALAYLKSLPPLAPGAFFEAYNIQKTVTGSEGLVPAYITVLSSLANGLQYTQSTATQLAEKYKNADELSKMKVSDLENDLSQAEGDFSAMMTGNGGTASPVTIN